MKTFTLGLAIRLSTCLIIASFFIYQFIQKQNELIELRLQIPLAQKELKSLEEENLRLSYSIDSFKNPSNLMELLRTPEFSHLKYPYSDDIQILYINP